MRLIDADVLKQHIDKLPALPDGNFAGNHSALKALINMQPTVQPEIIFCKDCEKHNKRFDEYPADEACPLTVWRVAQEHEFDYQFCAYAERRTDG